MTSEIVYEQDGAIGRITLNNPEKSNPITREILNKLIACFKLSHENQDTCVVYSAKGENFTFGADLAYGYELMTDPDKKSDAIEYLWSWQELTTVMIDHPGIIIVGYHGWIVGGGFEHTLACDLRIAAQSTQIMMPELDLGIFYSNASTKFLSQIVGSTRAKGLMLMGEKIDAKKALSIGLVNRVCSDQELDNVLNEYAQKIVSKDRQALLIAKKQINEAHENTLNEVLYKEGRAMIQTGRSDNAKMRIKTFLNNKK